MSNVDKGFVLRVTKVRESDLIVNIFSLNQGLVGCYLHNANRPGSKRRQLLEILNLVEFRWEQKNLDQLQHLAGVSELKLRSNFPALKQENHMFVESFVLAEALSRILPEHEPHPELFSLLEAATKLPANPEFTLKLFLYLSLNILQLQGYLPELTICQKTQAKLTASSTIKPLADGVGYYLSQASESSPLVIQAIKVQQFMLKPETNFAQLEKLEITEQLQTYLRDLQINWLEHVLGKPLKSKSLLVVV